MSPGDHIVTRITVADLRLFKFGFYTHHGIYVGDGVVVHWRSSLEGHVTLSSAKRRMRTSLIRETSLSDFSDGNEVWVRAYDWELPAEEAVRRARSRLGEDGYGFFSNNCEHFARWCKTGEHRSEQVAGAQRNLAAAGGKLAVKGGAKAVARVASGATVKAVAKAATPWTLMADVGQVAVEQVSAYAGLEPSMAKTVARGSGAIGTVGIGLACGGPIGAGVGLAAWLVGEVVGELVG